MQKMVGLNLELTTCCPLHCPQCYCTLEGGKHLDLEIAKSKLREAGEHGAKIVHLSGGETLCYPHLYEVVSFAKQYCQRVNVALCGWHFDQSVLNSLIQAGVDGIFISLNGSTEEINSVTRDGYEYALYALQILCENNFPNTHINWVMHSNNCDDFSNVLALAEKYNVKQLVVLAFKPDSHHQLLSFPSGEQIHRLANEIRAYKGKVQIGVETCFSQLLAVLKDTKLFGNLNVGPLKGCRAGLYNYSINIDGLYSPCRHLDYFEKYESLDEYLTKSPIIHKIKSVEDNVQNPCSQCRYHEYCRPCLAVSSKLHGDIFIGHEVCSLWK